MKAIRLNYEVMDECIQELDSLKVESTQTECPEMSGSGMAITGIRQLAQTYEQFAVSVESLIDETTRYLSQMVRDFKETDESMARELKKGVKS